tara:strand:- start:1420 stop:1605 length:186 start_codon:yes stop_codon:yes gene_type:complete
MAKYTQKRKYTKKSTSASTKPKTKKASKKKEELVEEPFTSYSFEEPAPQTLWGKVKSFFSS